MEGANEGWHEINKEGGMKAREGRRGGGWNFHLKTNRNLEKLPRQRKG